jgi:fatty-acyl-CoA synthase
MVISQWMTKQAYYQPDKTAIIFEGRKTTYSEFNKTINRITQFFKSIGVGKGDRVGVLMHNSPTHLEAYFACAKSGAIFLPFNFRLTIEELKYQIENCTPKLIIFSDDTKELVELTRKQLKNDPSTWMAVKCPNSALTDYKDFYAEISKFPPDEVNVQLTEDDPHMIMYSSGTTGYPKGIVMPHRKAFWNTINAVHALDLSRKDISLSFLPFFHSGGLNVVTIPTLYQGGTLVILPRFDEEKVLKSVEEFGCTNMVAVPAVYKMLLPEIDTGKYNISSLRFLLCGGAPMPVEVIQQYIDRKLDLMQVFGGTETSICVCLKPEDAAANMGSSGQPLMYVDVLVVDDDGNPVKQGEVGEAVTKGPSVMLGFWNDPEATKEVLKNGDEFHTGDLVTIDEGYYLRVVGRKKDMIICGGENVYPAEVERVILLNPCVEEVAVIGCKDEKWGEAVVAVAVLKKGKVLTIEDLKDHCLKYLAKFKVPKHLKIVEELPLSPTGKVRKEDLKKLVEGIW